MASNINRLELGFVAVLHMFNSRRADIELEFLMTEGKGYCARRQERLNEKRLEALIKNREQIVVIPDYINKKKPSTRLTRKPKRP